MASGSTSNASQGVPFRTVNDISTHLEIYNSFHEDTDFFNAKLISSTGKKKCVLARVKGESTYDSIIEDINHPLVMVPRVIFHDVAKYFYEVYNIYETTLHFQVNVLDYCLRMGGGTVDLSSNFKDMVRQIVCGLEFLHSKNVTIKTFDPTNIFLMITEPPIVKIGGDFIHCASENDGKDKDFKNLAIFLEHCVNVYGINDNEFYKVLHILRYRTNKSKSEMLSLAPGMWEWHKKSAFLNNITNNFCALKTYLRLMPGASTFSWIKRMDPQVFNLIESSHFQATKMHYKDNFLGYLKMFHNTLTRCITDTQNTQVEELLGGMRDGYHCTEMYLRSLYPNLFVHLIQHLISEGLNQYIPD